MARRRRVSGSAKLRRLLRRLPEDAQNEVRKAVEAAAARVYDDALAAMPKPGENPYSTGDLRRKFRVAYDKDGLRARVGSFGGRRQRAAHAHLVEFGTAAGPRKAKDGSTYQHPGTPAEPFLIPAYKKNIRWNIFELRSAVERAMKKATAGSGGSDE